MAAKLFSNIDKVVYILGANGVTEKAGIIASGSSGIYDIISTSLNVSVNYAKTMFYRAVEQEFFIKNNDTPVQYAFTKTGFERYQTMKAAEKQLEGANHTLEDLIKKFYFDHFCECVLEHKPLFEVRYKDIEKWLGMEFAESILESPSKLTEMNAMIKDIDLPIDDDFRPKISLIDIGKPYTLTVEEARKSIHTRKIIEVEGRMMSQTDVKPRFTISAHRCRRCGHITYINQVPGKFIEPFECDNDVCGRKGPFDLSIEDSTRFDSQEVIIESSQGSASIMVVLDNPLCTSKFQERDAKYVRIVGVLNIREVYKQGSKEFDYVLEANSIKLVDDNVVVPATPEEEKMFEDWAKNPVELRERLINSVAPSIHGRTEEKNALSLALFSDWTWTMKAGAVLNRSSLHVLLIGDPGTGKSQLLEDIIKLAPKAMLAQGENSTGVGLSNAAVPGKDGVWCIKAGLFAKADRGIVCLDELDKIKKEDLTVLNSILSRQEQIVNKAGMEVKFDTRCAALCGANPIGGQGHIDRYVPIIEQLGVNSFLFQRFDLVFVMQDIPDPQQDEIIFNKIFETYNSPSIGSAILDRPIPEELYKKYVLYARSKPKPEINDEAKKLLQNFYRHVREVPRTGRGSNEGRSDYPAISPRTAGALNKLTLVIARRELASKATVEHARLATELYMKMLVSVGLTGELDLMALEHGGTQSQLDRITMIRNILSTNKPDGLTIKELAEYTGYTADELRHTLASLKQNGEVVEPKAGRYIWA